LPLAGRYPKKRNENEKNNHNGHGHDNERKEKRARKTGYVNKNIFMGIKH
jgi:hypothetical protein